MPVGATVSVSGGVVLRTRRDWTREISVTATWGSPLLLAGRESSAGAARRSSRSRLGASPQLQRFRSFWGRLSCGCRRRVRSQNGGGCGGEHTSLPAWRSAPSLTTEASRMSYVSIGSDNIRIIPVPLE